MSPILDDRKHQDGDPCPHCGQSLVAGVVYGKLICVWGCCAEFPYDEPPNGKVKA